MDELIGLYRYNRTLPSINPDGKEIRGVNPVDNKSYFQYDFEKALDFLDVFDTNKSELFNDGNNDIYADYIYRGHSDSTWLLLPSHFREHQDKKAAYLSGNGHGSGEVNNFINFVKGLDDLGYSVSDESFRLIRLLNENSRINGLDLDLSSAIFDFPVKEQLSELALAQHYGVKTRLLDFSLNPMTAIFFATENLYPYNSLNKENKENKIGVWVIPRLLIEAVGVVRFLQFIDVKKYQNKYISAQKGVFLNYFPPVREASESSDNVENDNLLDISYTLDKLLMEDYQNEYLNKLIKEHIGKPMLFTLPERELFPIAKRLNQLNVNWITMMPSLDGVKKEVERQNKRPYSNKI
jgi:hypothetical protein